MKPNKPNSVFQRLLKTPSDERIEHLVELLSMARVKPSFNNDVFFELVRRLLERPTPQAYAQIRQVWRGGNGGWSKLHLCPCCEQITDYLHTTSDGERYCDKCYSPEHDDCLGTYVAVMP